MHFPAQPCCILQAALHTFVDAIWDCCIASVAMACIVAGYCRAQNRMSRALEGPPPGVFAVQLAWQYNMPEDEVKQAIAATCAGLTEVSRCSLVWSKLGPNLASPCTLMRTPWLATDLQALQSTFTECNLGSHIAPQYTTPNTCSVVLAGISVARRVPRPWARCEAVPRMQHDMLLPRAPHSLCAEGRVLDFIRRRSVQPCRQLAGGR